jgi:hypothetical protein
MPRPWFGGLGYASVAPFFGDISGLESMLAGPTALGASYAAPKSAVLIGGGGGAVLFGHLWLGGKGFGLVSGGFDNTLGAVTIGGGGGSFELGYVAVPLPQLFVIPYFGVGGFRAGIEVENLTTNALVDGTRSLAEDANGVRVIAPPGGTRNFEAGFATLDAGIRVMRLLSPRGGGFAAGFELGFLSSFTQPAWGTEGYEVTNAESAGLEGLYIRLNIGGGGFAFR